MWALGPSSSTCWDPPPLAEQSLFHGQRPSAASLKALAVIDRALTNYRQNYINYILR